MAIPVVESTVSTGLSSGTSADVTVPSGVVADDIILLFIALDGVGSAPEANADGFATLFADNSFSEVDGTVLWKRATGADSGTYTINWTGTEAGRCTAVRVSGCVTSGDPWDVISAAVKSNGGVDNTLSRLTSTVVNTLAIYGLFCDRNRIQDADTITGTDWTEVATSASFGGAGGAGNITASNPMASVEQVEAGTFGTWSGDENLSRGFNLKGAGGLAIVKVADEILDLSEGTPIVVRALVRLKDEILDLAEGALSASIRIRLKAEILDLPEDANPLRFFVKIKDEILDLVEGAIALPVKAIQIVNEVLQLQDTQDIEFSSLQARIKFDDDLLDSSGNGNNGTITEGSEQYVTGKKGKAFDFDGTQRIPLANQANFSKDLQTDPYSIAWWAKIPSSISTAASFANKSSTIASAAGQAVFHGATGSIGFKHGNGATRITIATTDLFADDEWHHFVATSEGIGDRKGLRIYVDGVLNVTGTPGAITGSGTTGAAMHVGSETDGGGKYTGLMDDIQFYDKQLNGEEIRQMWDRAIVHRGRVFEKSEILDLVEGAIAKVTAGAALIIKVSDEILDLVEDRNFVRGRIKVNPEILDLSEGTVFTRALIRLKAEILDLVEGSLAHRARVFLKAEILDLVEVANPLRPLIRVATTEILDLVEGAANVLGIVREKGEILDLPEDKVSVLGVVKEKGEILDLPEARNFTRALIRLKSEILELVEGTVITRALVRLKAEVLELVEGSLAHRVRIFIAAEILDLSEGSLAHRARVFLKSEVLELVEGSIAVSGLVRLKVEILDLVESALALVPVAGLIVKVVSEILEIVEAGLALPEITVRIKIIDSKLCVTLDPKTNLDVTLDSKGNLGI